MKRRTGFINLICALIAVAVVAISVTLILVFNGAISHEKTTVVISSSSATTTYDGTVLTNSQWNVLEGKLASGHKLEVSVSGEQLNVGISQNYVNAVVKDKHGKNVSDQYNIVYKPGTLTVKARPITLVAGSDMKLYDGTPLVANGFTVKTPISLIEGHTVNATVNGDIIAVGKAVTRIVDFNITDAHGNDVTRNYSVKRIKGELTVHPSDSIVIQSEDEQKYYDGEALTSSGWFQLSGTIDPSHTLKVEMISSITEVGSVENDFNVYIYDSEGNDVTSYYNVVKIKGKLVVMR